MFTSIPEFNLGSPIRASTGLQRGVDPEFPLTDYGSRGSLYDPRVDHPFLIPSTVVFGPDTNLDDLAYAVSGAKDGKSRY